MQAPATVSLLTLLIPQIPMIFTSLATLVVAVSGIRKLREGQTKAAVTASDVKKTLSMAHDATDKKLDTIHTLVNSDHSVSLRLAANYASRIAGMTKDPIDVKNAQEATRAADEHDALQQVAAR